MWKNRFHVPTTNQICVKWGSPVQIGLEQTHVWTHQISWLYPRITQHMPSKTTSIFTPNPEEVSPCFLSGKNLYLIVKTMVSYRFSMIFHDFPFHQNPMTCGSHRPQMSNPRLGWLPWFADQRLSEAGWIVRILGRGDEESLVHPKLLVGGFNIWLVYG